MEKLAKNQIRQIQKIYQNTFDFLYTYSTRKSLKIYQKGKNGTMKLILWKKPQKNLMQRPTQ